MAAAGRPAVADRRQPRSQLAVGSEGWLLIGVCPDPKHQARLVVPAVSDTKKTHSDLATDSDRRSVIWVRDRPDLTQAARKAVREKGAGGFCGKATSPAVGMKMPADFDLALTVGQGLEQYRPGRDAGGALDDRPGPKPRIARELRPVLLNEVDGVPAVRHRPTANPCRHLRAAVHVIKPVGLVRTPRPDDHSLSLGDDVLPTGVRHPPIIDRARGRQPRRRQACPRAGRGGASIAGRSFA